MLRRSILFPLVLMALLLLVLGWLVLATNSQFQAAARAQTIISELDDVQTQLVDGETGLRGYELTRDQRFLEPYTLSKNVLPMRFQDLRRLLSQESTQMGRLYNLENLYQIWLKISAPNQPLPPNLKTLNLDLARKVQMDAMRASVSQIVGAEQDSLENDMNQQRLTAFLLLLMLGGATVIGGGLLAYQSARTVRSLSERYERSLALVRTQTAELKASYDELDRRVEERTRELNTVNKELEVFSYSAAHDLRAPLRWIIGTNRLFMEDYGHLVPAEGLVELERVNAAAARLSKLIDSLLEMARLGRVEVRKEKVDLSQIARDKVRELESKDGGAKVNIHVQPGMAANGDPVLLSMLMQNLLENAMKFSAQTGEGNVKIEEHKDDGQTVFSVSDNGVGFDKSCIAKLFQPFERLHRDDEFAGTGMGLANARRIVERHGGRIWADGEVGKGATFYFTLQ